MSIPDTGNAFRVLLVEDEPLDAELIIDVLREDGIEVESRRVDDEAGYREELFQFVYQRPPSIGTRDRVLSERAYASTLSHIAPRKLPTLSRWTVIFLLGLLGLLALSEILWLWQSWPVRQVLQGGPAAVTEAPR